MWTRSYRSVLDQMVSLGFNVIRLHFSNEMLRNTTATFGLAFDLNPELEDLTPVEVMDKIVDYAGVVGLQIILDRNSARMKGYANETLWYIPEDPYYTEELFVSDWVMLAKRYVGTAVIGVDLWNEPKDPCTWGAGLDTDWNAAAERVGNAIQAVNPDLLIIVEGIQNNSWWGSNLEGVATHPIRLSVPNKVVYSVHEYPNDAAHVPGFNQSWINDPTFPNNMRGRWNKNFGYLVQQNIAPVYVGEFGTSLKDEKDFIWLKLWLRYMNGEFLQDGVNELKTGQMGLSWTFWCISIDADSERIKGNFGGILLNDWYTVNEYKMAILTQFESLPTQAPTVQPVYSDYLHTLGSQIVDVNNNAVRLTGINW